MRGADIFELWTAAIVFSFAFLFFGSSGIQEKRNTIAMFSGIALLLIGAIVGTVLLAIGAIPPW